MTFERDVNPELTTTRTGGRSARLVALGAIVVLGGVAFIGIAGREPVKPTDVATSRPAAAAAIVPAPTASETPRKPTTGDPASYPSATVIVASNGVPSETLGISILVGTERTVSSLDEGVPRQFHTAYLVPLPVPDPGAIVQLVNRSRSYSDNAYETFALPADDFNFGGDPTVVVDVLRDPQPHGIGVTQLIRNGYRLWMTIEPASSFAVLTIDLSVGSDPTFPNERYDVVALADGKVLSAALDTSVPGFVHGRILFSDRPKSRKVTLKLSAIQPDNRFPGTVVVNSYELALPRSKSQPTFVDDLVDPDPRGNGLVGLIANGYYWRSSLSYRGGHYVLDFDLEVNPTIDQVLFPRLPPFTADTTAHRWVTGDDGLVGWPPGPSS